MRQDRAFRIVRLVTVLAACALALVAFLSFRLYKANADKQQSNVLSSETYEGIHVTGLGGSPAPDFTLADQSGNRIQLSRLRSKAVVLSFMDPRCTDVCPIVSREYVRAYRGLGSDGKDVVFLAVNINQYHRSIQDVRSFSRRNGLAAVPSWHFLTGSTRQLKQVWKDYGIMVTSSKSGDVLHSEYLYFIDRQGNERWLAGASREQTEINAYASLIAHYSGESLRD